MSLLQFRKDEAEWSKVNIINNLKKKLIKNFTIWTSGNEKIDDFIQDMQLRIENYDDIIFEWIPYNQFSDIKEIDKDYFTTVYSAVWKDGLLCYNKDKKEWTRTPNYEVTLKCLSNSQNTSKKILNEV
jgi:hypothetical protein